ncbi:class I SAM-dependent methyltransferase [Aliidiomarina maris]|uniref:Methyltransferase family protein n=1 Tax=Aliidiomarina maris TaxID=531312 RepID=A0A327WSK6_9GAMM|nr:class I SAM-dependent methyltransferase [Aliidiomarina maris]RAJ95350.1 hypothetical protein B0I24_11032 [Aliidiomarina maris]RUO22758.1 hypothetical protein CWE07_10870 [Aliidiomarina maris]
MKHSALFTYIERLQGERPWGHFLDAGTGAKSLAWVGSLDTKQWTAVTASTSMAEQSKAQFPGVMRPQNRIPVENWIDPKLVSGETFDTVLLDYFVGAVEGFAPYWQESVLPRVSQLVAPGGRLYITALDPYVPLHAEDEVGRFVGAAMLKHADEMQQRGLELIARHDGLAHGFDYVIAAERTA